MPRKTRNQATQRSLSRAPTVDVQVCFFLFFFCFITFRKYEVDDLNDFSVCRTSIVLAVYCQHDYLGQAVPLAVYRVQML
jgi:hypothetical protein